MSTILQGLTNLPKQQQPIKLPDGSTVTLYLEYRPQQVGWFFDIAWDGQTPTWVSNGSRLVTSPNILRQYKNQTPFGITVSTTNNLDPTGQEAFVDGSCTLLLLDESDIIALEAVIYPGN